MRRLWKEPPESDEKPLPRTHKYMTTSSSYPLYCGLNDGYIEVENESHADGDNNQGFEEDLINMMKDRAKKVNHKTKSKSRKSTESQASQPEPIKTAPPVLPSAPDNPFVPATFSHRQKGHHHAAGWHHRTVMESEAAEKLMSLIDLEVGDVFCFVVDLVADARQKILRLIAEGDEEMVENSLKQIVGQLDDSSVSYVIQGNHFKVISKESAAQEDLTEAAKLASENEALRSLLALLNKHLDPPCRQLLSSNGCASNALGKMEGAMDVEMP